MVDGIELPAIIRNAKQPSGSPGPTTWRFVDLGPPTPEAHTHPDPEKNNDCASHNEVNDADDDYDALLEVLHRATARRTGSPPFGGIAIRPYSGAGGVWWCPSAMSDRDAADILASASSSGTSNPDTPVKADEIRETLACEKRGNGRNVSLLPLTIVDDESDEELLRESKHEPMDVDPDIDMGDMLYVRTERSQAIVRVSQYLVPQVPTYNSSSLPERTRYRHGHCSKREQRCSPPWKLEQSLIEASATSPWGGV